ncbi:hypothetical protein M2459_000800 [Parabacteroides sp. PF5-5]|uniref:head GIN domain-containing protein n=1 Tax=unclassified Parabacteroides TaxID=2649774 RepID=UPI002474133A|nr:MULTISPECIES: head GIN domain-containing protein [unclassified Parabacteroides]MDH6304088.1 hypothetical protein [Parabacteroides sp. PH5-39]MDH6315212.1 hypothetical protein [Parabacteroides sp. PF5-13]MDH6318857.1 hypothetical protein [Parabacteroides sp. PH5-13]MDH6322586.1 hypothetical protein [Parabacteroides sp. PH5-8]MDH6326262.1 hypothetical protein [Parabacteroides sp. PH5-41]
MNKKNYFLIVCVFLLTATYSSVYAAKEKGNGILVTKEIQVDDFNSIRMGPGIECNSKFFNRSSYENPVFNYEQSSGKATLSITIDENLFPLLKINTSGNELSIETSRGTSINPSKLEIKGSSKNLRKVSVSGCVDLVFTNKFEADLLNIQISGACDVRMNKQARIGQLEIRISGAGDLVADNLVCKEVDINVSGAGDITMKGEADNAQFTVTGAGDIKAYDFIVKDLVCRVSGSGDVKANASGTLDASVSGTGDILYKGSARANTRITGFGDIRKMGD